MKADDVAIDARTGANIRGSNMAAVMLEAWVVLAISRLSEMLRGPSVTSELALASTESNTLHALASHVKITQ